MDVDGFLNALRGTDFYDGQIVHRRDLPPREPEFAPDDALPDGVAGEVCAALDIGRLYAFQAAALESVRAGDDVVLHGGPAGGKSLVFQVPAVERALEEPAGATLIICPYKPVARAQRWKFDLIAERLTELGRSTVLYDGDLSPHMRRTRRGRPLVITNPDMVHRGMLPYHPRWAEWFGRLRMVVLEELHTYSGLFGANVACLLRRLQRVCAHYGADPQFVATTSTLSNPSEHFERLVGREARVIRAGDGPGGPRTHVFWRPHVAAPTVEAGHLMAELVRRGHGTIAFTRARVAAELIAQYARQRLEETGGPADSVIVYRGGYPPEERRALEDRLRSGDALGVATTNVLELGLDLPTLDAVISCGWPGSRASFLQQAARAGRRGQPSLAVLVPLHDPVNSFLLGHPEYVFDRPVEPAVVERGNPHVLAGHLRCAAHELPLNLEQAETFGENAADVLEMLEGRRKLFEKDGVWYHAAADRPAREMPLRGYFDRNVVVQDRTNGEVVAEVDWMGAHSVVHPQAIYLHGDRRYLVQEFDREERHAWVTPIQVDYYTNPLGHCFVQSVDECLRERELPGGTAFFGEVTAGCITTGYEERRFGSNELIRSVPLEIPPVTQQTMGLWLCLSPTREAELTALGLSPEYYGLGNALRIVLPLFMTCDVLDLRPWSGQTNFSWEALYFYERYPRGLGFTERVFDALDEVMAAAARNLADCDCESGCPTCVGDPPRPFMVNNPELEADFIPDRDEVRLLLACLRQEDPLEDLLVEVFGRQGAADMLAGRRELLEQKRQEAVGAPARVLPADAPAESSEPGRRLPLQLERGIRRRIEKMRTAEEREAYKAIGRATIPEPEEKESLPKPDPAMRRGAEPPEARPLVDRQDLAAEAVRRMRARKKRESQDKEDST
ncbi:MAG: Zn-binding domain-containing protein [Candidatus Brocadiia bacterium]